MSTRTAPPPEVSPAEPAPLPAGIVPIAKPLQASVERLTWRIEDVAGALGILRRAPGTRAIGGEVPPPDLTIGRMPLWLPETIRAWVAKGARS